MSETPNLWKSGINNNELKRRNTIGSLDQYTRRGLRLKQSGTWTGLGVQVRAEDGNHEAVRLVNRSRYSWLSGDFIFRVAVKPEILSFQIKFYPEGQGQSFFKQSEF